MFPGDIRYQVAERINGHDFADEGVVFIFRLRGIQEHDTGNHGADVGKITTGREISRARGVYVTAMKRAGYDVGNEGRVLDFTDFEYLVTEMKERKQSVVRTDKEIILRPDSNIFSFTPDTGIDDADMDRPVREVIVCGCKRKTPAENILRGNVVSDVDKPGIGIYRQDGPLHDPRIGITGTEIGCEGDKSACAQSISSSW